MKFKSCALAAVLAISAFAAQADIFAQSGYHEGRDGILLMTERCPADSSGELKVAVMRAAGRAMEGCYVINNRGNAIVKWINGEIQELDWKIFGARPLGSVPAPKGSDGYSDWSFFNDTTSKGTPICGIFTASTDKTNMRNASVKQLANREVLSVTLFNDKWSFKENWKLPVVLDFADNEPLKLDAYANDKVVDIEIPAQIISTFLGLMTERKAIRFKVGSGSQVFWSIPLHGMKGSIKQLVECSITLRKTSKAISITSRKEDLPEKSTERSKCKKLYQSWIFNNMLEESCELKMGVARNIGIVAKSICLKSSDVERNQWGVEVFKDIKNDLDEMGGEEFCRRNKPGYEALAKQMAP